MTPPAPKNSFDRRGVSVSRDEVPSVVWDGFMRRSPKVSAPQIEKCDNGETYRFALPNGEVLFLNTKGEWCGVVL